MYRNYLNMSQYSMEKMNDVMRLFAFYITQNDIFLNQNVPLDQFSLTFNCWTDIQHVVYIPVEEIVIIIGKQMTFSIFAKEFAYISSDNPVGKVAYESHGRNYNDEIYLNMVRICKYQ